MSGGEHFACTAASEPAVGKIVQEVAEAAILSWNWEPGILLALLFSAWIYIRGWRRLQSLAPLKFPLWRLISFLGGILTIFLAISSPLDAFGNFLLQAHMVQHMLLMMVAPPFLLFGFPYLPILLGLPRSFVSGVLGPFLSWKLLKKIGRFITHPLVCLGIFIFSNIFWHIPPLYELALRFPEWHRVEHASFIGTALLFWWPIIQPWPSRPQWPRWAMIPYLLIADIQNTALSAILSFYDQVLYPSYLTAPRISDISALSDQAAAGAIMWVPGSIAFLIPAAWVAVQFLKPQRKVERPRTPALQRVPFSKSSPFDLFKLPIIGALLHSRIFRRVLQTSLLLLAVLIMLDGWFGPQFGPMNLAGTLPWTHWRGLTVFALLIAGNFFCMACPFTFARDLARRFLPARWNWPSRLRTKWISVVLLALYLWAYEAFSLWNSPWLTAWMIAGYFVAAILIDGFFRNASFCKYVCPIGQFHFVQSLNSPLQIQVRDPAACASCRTYDCIQGNQDTDARGCELQLFPPRKQGNMNCTFCLDCVRACPKDNVGLIASAPWRDLTSDPPRSGVGKFSQKLDLAVIITLLTFGAFANAAGMVTPVLQWEDRMKLAWGLSSRLPVVTLFYIFALLVIPATFIWLAIQFSLRLGRTQAGWKQIFCQFAVSFAPLGFGMWLAHFLFHFFTASHTFIPVFQRIFSDLGWSILGSPNWSIRSWAFPSLLKMELLLLDLGFLSALFVAWKRAAVFKINSNTSRFGIFLPWGLVLLLLYVVGMWICFQPMDMRGTMMG
ncbi:MAG: hypothetical protein C5B47_07600 [Verrucomicrobia bacterium]|nr:MAG: hypothetical protein C5B47_07600 [Verrucomicrobiota bacterium]